MTGGLSPIEGVKQRHRLADVAQRTGIALPPGRAGLVTVRCPMPAHGHYDRTPSLRLQLGQDRWWCFSCSPANPRGTPMAGDVIDWVQHTEQVDWHTAITILDSGRPLTNAWQANAGTPNREWSTGQTELPNLKRTPPKRVRQAIDAAWACYTRPELHLRGLCYLSDRGIDASILEEHNRRTEVGHTPGPRDGLVRLLTSSGFTTDELVDAGLAQRPPDRPVTDFYRDRVLIPLRDDSGAPIGFIGRNIGDARWPKYKNPPHTHLYDKSINLYQPLPPPGHPTGRAIIVEGTIDAMAIAVTSIKAGTADRLCPVTQSGRELSVHQLAVALALSTLPPLVAFDGDPPGRQSNHRVAAAAHSLGAEVVVVDFPDGEDPASLLLAHGVAGLARWIHGETPASRGSCHGKSVDSRFRATVSPGSAASA